MRRFSLSLRFPPSVRFSIEEKQCWHVCTDDTDLVSGFFSWLETGKYIPGAFIGLKTGDLESSDPYLARHYFRCLRFSAGRRESEHYYYQQRYHSTENESVEKLRDYLGQYEERYFEEVTIQLGLNDLLDETINMLSTGEFRKACLLKEAMTEPGVLFLDEPFAGLDPGSRAETGHLLEHLVNNGTSLVIFSASSQLPVSVTNTFHLAASNRLSSGVTLDELLIPSLSPDEDYEKAFELNEITARYNGRDVLHKVSWSVGRGEKWSLTGHNGAGKSTLLSFVYADNPQVYGNDVWLFGRKRGSGESIWELKDRIGFYSSELHRYFNKVQTVTSAVDSLVYQNPYERRIFSGAEKIFREQLLGYFGLEDLMQRMLYDLPVVTQKLVLLTAVFLKNAPLVILDEPFQGFSREQIHKILVFLERYSEDRTLVMVSHDFADFPPSVDRHFLLDHGVGTYAKKLPVRE